MNLRLQFSPLLYLLPFLTLAGFLFASGCSDVVGVDPVEVDTFAEEPDKKSRRVNGRDVAAWAKEIRGRSKKARHYHLLDRAIVPAAAGKTTGGQDSVRLLVGVKPGSTADSVLQVVLDKHKIFNRFQYKTALHGRAVTVPAANLDSFITDTDKLHEVEWTEPDAAVPYGTGTTATAASGTQEIPWGITNIGADASSTLAGDGAGAVDVDLYILDTGVDNPDLNIVECLEFTRRTGAVPCTSSEDPDGHGTGVAAVAAALDNQTGIVGAAPGARVHVVKALRDRGKTPLGALVAVVDFLTERKVANPSVPMVVNISLGADVKTKRYNSLDEAIQESIAAGVVYVLSAGNDAINAEDVSPAHVAEAITVGAYDENGQFSSFSNYGLVLDVLAPGEEIPTLTPQNDLGYTSGTSVAAPYVAGAAALLLAQEPGLTPAEVRERIVASAQATIGGTPPPTTNKALFVDW